MSADTNDQNPPNTQTNTTENQGDTVSKTLATYGDQLKAMNEQMQQMMTTVAETVRRNQPPPRQEEDENLYDPKRLLGKAEEVMNRRLSQERAKDAVIFNLAQEYPEIQSNQAVRNAVLEAQRALPEHLRDTAEGYEMAVLKAVSKNALIPKSKRQTVEEDFSVQPRGSAGGAGGQGTKAKGKTKLAPETLELAEIMGMDINDPKVVERLTAHAERPYSKYR